MYSPTSMWPDNVTPLRPSVRAAEFVRAQLTAHCCPDCSGQGIVESATDATLNECGTCGGSGRRE